MIVKGNKGGQRHSYELLKNKVYDIKSQSPKDKPRKTSKTNDGRISNTQIKG